MDNKAIIFRFDDWLIEPLLNQVRREDETKQLEPLAMNVLSHLLKNAGEVVTADELLDRFWSGRNAEPSMVHRCITQIRSALGDDAKNPVYVETIRKRGYRAIATVLPMTSSSTSTATEKSIAVLPFVNMSNDLDQEYFSDGITEDILNELARNTSLTVRPRSSAFALKGLSLDRQEIGQRLNVTHVLEGSVRRSGERVRVTVQLSEVDANKSVWSQRYDRDLTDIFEVQDEITGEILVTLKRSTR